MARLLHDWGATPAAADATCEACGGRTGDVASEYCVPSACAWCGAAGALDEYACPGMKDVCVDCCDRADGCCWEPPAPEMAADQAVRP